VGLYTSLFRRNVGLRVSLMRSRWRPVSDIEKE
jgi:hypothetical protein